jgi:hypothetical protein
MQDIRSRVANRIQLTTDQLSIYLKAVDRTLGTDVDYAMLQKIYAGGGDGQYSPAGCVGYKKVEVTGAPDPGHISTSCVERQNLTMRMSMRRFTRLTNGFSKKIENHAAATAPHAPQSHADSYDAARHSAMATGVADHVWSIEEIVALLP